MTDKEKIHELEQQVIDMAIEITRLRKENKELKEYIFDVFTNKHKYFKSSDIQSELTAQSHQSNSTLPDQKSKV